MFCLKIQRYVLLILTCCIDGVEHFWIFIILYTFNANDDEREIYR